MIESKAPGLCSVVVASQWPLDRLSGLVVVPDRRSKGKDPRQNPDHNARLGPSAVSFQVQLAFEGLVDRLDGLPQWAEQCCAGPFGLALAGRAQQGELTRGQFVLEA